MRALLLLRGEQAKRRAADRSALARRSALLPDTAKAILGFYPDEWPWNITWWKPSTDPVRNLTKAGALIAAEIERIQRAVNK